ncbi:MAG TPA: hypothetical protein VM695_13645, partial [Phycisphaerae bacterium]|nr:hypothetical protein [Phycisphaerae bacterium]
MNRGRFLTAAVAILLLASTAPAQTRWFGVDSTWAQAMNWNPAVVPDANTVVLIDDTALGLYKTIDLQTGPRDANWLELNTIQPLNSYTITNGTLSLTNGLRNLAGQHTISAAISGAPTGIQVNGGKLTLSGDNTGVTGNLSVTGAAAVLAAPASVGTMDIVLDGGTVDLAGGAPGVPPDLRSFSPDTLDVYLTFDGDVADSSGNANDGTIGGNVAFVDGKRGQAATFDGVNDYVSLGNLSSMI